MDDLISWGWPIGWFVTVAIGAGLSFAYRDVIDAHAKEVPNDLPFLALFLLAALFAGIAWPLLLACEIGWFLWPLLRKARAFREAHDQ